MLTEKPTVLRIVVGPQPQAQPGATNAPAASVNSADPAAASTTTNTPDPAAVTNLTNGNGANQQKEASTKVNVARDIFPIPAHETHLTVELAKAVLGQVEAALKDHGLTEAQGSQETLNSKFEWLEDYRKNQKEKAQRDLRNERRALALEGVISLSPEENESLSKLKEEDQKNENKLVVDVAFANRILNNGGRGYQKLLDNLPPIDDSQPKTMEEAKKNREQVQTALKSLGRLLIEPPDGFSDLEEAKRRLADNGFELYSAANEVGNKLRVQFAKVVEDLQLVAGNEGLDELRRKEVAEVIKELKTAFAVLSHPQKVTDIAGANLVLNNGKHGYGKALELLSNIEKSQLLGSAEAGTALKLISHIIKYDIKSGDTSLTELKRQFDKGDLNYHVVDNQGIGTRPKSPVLARVLGTYLRIGGAVPTDHRLKQRDANYIKQFVIDSVIRDRRPDQKTGRCRAFSEKARQADQTAISPVKVNEDFFRKVLFGATVFSTIAGGGWLIVPVVLGPTFAMGIFRGLAESRADKRRDEIRVKKNNIIDPKKSNDSAYQAPPEQPAKPKPDDGDSTSSGNADGSPDGGGDGGN